MGILLLIVLGLVVVLCFSSTLSLAIRGRFNKQKIIAIVKQDLRRNVAFFRKADANRSLRDRVSQKTRSRLKASIKRRMK